MILALDAGNTRIKWGLYQPDQGWLAHGALAHGAFGELAALVRRHGQPAAVAASNVAGPIVAEELQALAATWGLPLQRVASQASQCGVINQYREPARLGADRWAALIGARHLHPGPCLVVSAGTATTVDLLAADGCFLGGLILPGLDLMRHALAANTAQLAYADGCFTPQPRSSEDAIYSGCVTAQLGAIERMYRQLPSGPDTLCLLTGGTAPALAPHLAIPHRVEERLVLEGVVRVAVG